MVILRYRYPLFALKVLVNRRQKYAAVTLIISLLLVTVIVTYAQLQSNLLGIDVIGQTLVDSEFPSPSISSFYLKPATWLMIMIVIAWYSFIEIIKDRVRSEKGFARPVISIGLLLAIILCSYEVAYNFMIWGVMMINADETSFHPDEVVNVFPSDKYKTNLVFATKSFVTILGCGFYGFYVLREDRGNSG